MKQLASITAAAVLVCVMALVVPGCAMFGSHQKANATPSTLAAASATNEATSASNEVTTTITTKGAVTTTVNGVKVTTVANGAASSPGATQTGAESSSSHGPLFYFYFAFAAAMVIWIVWAVWHSYRRRHPVRVHRRHRTT